MPINRASLVKCTITRLDGFDAFGQPKFHEPIDSLCAVVKHEISSQQSTVRADSSSTKGHAFEDIASFVGLFLPETVIQKEDIVDILGQKFRVITIRQRMTVTGKIDHQEVTGVIHG